MSEYSREPLVELRNSNARTPSAYRKSLPTRRWSSNAGQPVDSANMDRDRSTNTAALKVDPAISFFLDCEDYRSR